MRLLIIANSNIVFANELKSELTSKGYDVTLLDFESLLIIDSHNSKDETYLNKFHTFKVVRKLSMIFRMFYIRKIIKSYNFDRVNIHYSRWYYLLILGTLKQQTTIVTFYGSDFYRTSNLVKNLQKPLLRNASLLTFTNPMTQESFVKYYNDFKEKSQICRFGLKTLDYIDKNRAKSKGEIREVLGYSQEKLVVTCGYNATRAQQHDTIIQSIIQLPQNIKDRVQFVFPLTYGDDVNRKRVKNLLGNTDLDYIVLEEFLYENENAYVKLGSDIMINVLQTDSFSGSMQEFLYAKNVVITGSWLPYGLFDSEGVVYHKINNTNELTNRLKEIIANIVDEKKYLHKNIEIISNLSSWKNNIDSWREVYEK